MSIINKIKEYLTNPFSKEESVVVTAEDIEGGSRYCCSRCPIALAITRKIGQVVWVTTQGVYVSPFRQIYEHTAESRNFARKFDNGETVHPGKIHLRRI